MYNVKGSRVFSVGFRGYLGGLEASWMISEREFASTCRGPIVQKPAAKILCLVERSINADRYGVQKIYPRIAAASRHPNNYSLKGLTIIVSKPSTREEGLSLERLQPSNISDIVTGHPEGYGKVIYLLPRW